MIPQVGGFQGCYLDNHRNNWRCARAVRKRPLGHLQIAGFQPNHASPPVQPNQGLNGGPHGGGQWWVHGNRTQDPRDGFGGP